MIQRFSSRLSTIPNSIWNMITSIDEVKGRWIGAANLHPYVLNQLKQSVLVTSTGASTRIEGTQMSDEDIEKMLRGISLRTFNDRDKQEVQGYYELLEQVFESWQGIRFSENTINHFHKELLKYASKDALHRGEYKHEENKVIMINKQGVSIGTLFDTTPAYLTPKEMLELTEWTQAAIESKQIHPLLIIANFIVEFLNIHPFKDGNGRLSRILTNLLMLKSNYGFMPYISHEKIIEDNKPDYYIALRTSQKTFKTKHENIIPWLEFFLHTVQKQSQLAIDLLSAKHIEIILSPNQLLVWNYMQKVDEVTPKQIATHTNVARPTVNQVLSKLLELDKIEKLGLGSATRYRKR